MSFVVVGRCAFAIIDINTSGIPARLQRALSNMLEVWQCLPMKLTADQCYYASFCILVEPGMFKPLSYSSEFVSVCQHLWFSNNHASINSKNIREGSPDEFMSQWLQLLLLANSVAVARKNILRGRCLFIHICSAHEYMNTWIYTNPKLFNILATSLVKHLWLFIISSVVWMIVFR